MYLDVPYIFIIFAPTILTQCSAISSDDIVASLIEDALPPV